VYFDRGVAEPDLKAAEQLYEKAVERDPTFALAFAQLSLTHDQLYWFYYDRTEERLAKQKEAAERAIQLRPDLAEGHLALGFYHYHGRLDYQRALEELESARKLQPSNGKVYFGLGAVHRREGRWTEAVEDIKKSVELNPRSVSDLTEMALTFIMLRAYPDAEPYLSRAVEISPEPRAYGSKSFLYLLWRGDTVAAANVIREAMRKVGAEKMVPWSASPRIINPWVRRAILSMGPVQVSRDMFGSDTVRYYYWQAVASQKDQATARAFFDSARVVLEGQTARQPDDPGFHRDLGIVYADLERRADARREGERALAMLPRSRDAMGHDELRLGLARILTKTGEVDAAIDQLGHLLTVPATLSVPSLRVDHTWDPLRENPRFEQLIGSRNTQ
jgi:tetratricopeptide (TPR) repeat protein